MAIEVAAARAAFERDGFAVIGEVLSTRAVRDLRDALEALPHERRVDGPYGIFLHNAWQQLPAVKALMTNGAMAELMCALLGCHEITLFQDGVVWKPGFGGKDIPWHQDYGYWPLSSPSAITIWMALDDATVERGCLHFIPGTQQMGERQPARFGPGSIERPELPPLTPETLLHTAVAVELPAGHALVHHPLVWHHSPPNRTAEPRRALFANWLAPDVRWVPERANHPLLYQTRAVAGARPSGPLFPRFRAS